MAKFARHPAHLGRKRKFFIIWSGEARNGSTENATARGVENNLDVARAVAADYQDSCIYGYTVKASGEIYGETFVENVEFAHA